MPLKTSRFTFLQISDIHLDSRLSANCLGLSSVSRHEFRLNMLKTLFSAFLAAQDELVDAILIPGNLFENEYIRKDTILKVMQAMGQLGDTPVVIAPGDTDHYSFDSPYNSQILSTYGLPLWPSNVHIFTSDTFSTFLHPKRPDVSFTGRALTTSQRDRQRWLSTTVAKDERAPLNILLFHGCLEDDAGADASQRGKLMAPFSRDELESLGFVYAALGHYPDLTQVKSKDGKLLGAYSGCLLGRSFDEAGGRYALIGSIDPSSMVCTLEPVELNNRRMVMVRVDITGLSYKQMIEEIVHHIEEQGVREEQDFICLNLEGNYHQGNEPSLALETLREKYYHLIVIDNTRPDYLSEHFDQRTTEWKFTEAMLEMMKPEQMRANEHMGWQTPGLSGRTVEDALYYGLDALRQQKVAIRNVD